MPKSMTGYGSGLSTWKGRVIRVECRSVNHRYLDVSVRLPSGLFSFELAVRARVQQVLDRGRVEIRVTDESAASCDQTIVFDKSLAESYLAAFKQLEALTGQPSRDLTTQLASIDGVFCREDSEEEDQALEKQIMEALDIGLAELDRARGEEGSHLAGDLLFKCGDLRANVQEVAKRASDVPRLYREKLLLRA
ncbi:MAG TPA: YicC/YloC family endoribonuclease, partial [Clostridia bacterium]|nr:YicC/YloC family endoribonuclease [Clostridia bacterium]